MDAVSVSANRIVLLHLSDIHFHGRSGAPYDLDDDLRNELERDAKNMHERMGRVDAILVTGDLAFSGKSEEYDAAQKWLEGLARELECRSENVWTVPGNHDVDRAMISESPLLETAHEAIRCSKLPELDDVLGRYLSDAEAAEVLYRPLEEYNRFAKYFGCRLSPEQPTWTHTLTGGNGLSIRMHGLNSVLVSDKTDDCDTAKLVLGNYQTQLRRKDGILLLTLCHHPPDWLRDQATAERFLNSRAHIQLFGHSHLNYLKVEALGEDASLRIGAGAVHPDRRETGWQPRYNLISVMRSGPETPVVAVDVFPRMWDPSATRFVPDTGTTSEDCHQFVIKLNSTKQGGSGKDRREASVSVACNCDNADDTDEIDVAEVTRAGTVNPYRRLAYRFLTLPYRARIAVAHELDLYADDDAGVAESELFRRFFRRARELDRLRELWDKVEDRHEKGCTEPNPFAAGQGEEEEG